MASRTTKIKIDTEANTTAIKKAANEVKKLQKAGDNVAKGQTNLANVSAKANKRISHSAGMAAMQFQDVAVQAQMGTDAVRILGQQGPQLLSAFGPTGMIAGLGVAVGAGIISALKKPEEKLSDILDDMDALQSAGQAIAEITFTGMENSLKNTADRAKEAADAFAEMSQRQADSEARSLSATDALIQAEMTLAKLRGEDTSLQELQLKQEQDQRKIQQEKEAASNAIAKARHAAVQEEEKLNAQLELQNEKIEAQRRLIATTEQKRESAFRGVERAQDKMGRNILTLGLSKGHTPSKKQLDAFDQANDAVLAINQELDEAKTELNNLLSQQQNMTTAIRNAKEAVADIEGSMTGELAKIDMQAKATNIQVAGESMGKQLDLLEDALKKGAEAIGDGAPSNVIARLGEILEDGIQTQELDELVTITGQLGVKLNEGFGKQNQTMKQALDSLITQQDQLNNLEASFKTLQARQKTKGR